MATGGFQTQLSETFNKRVGEGQPRLEGFLTTGDRRLAFRLVNPDGSVVPQPRVTSGFTPRQQGRSTSGTDFKDLIGVNKPISSTASEELINVGRFLDPSNTGGFAASEGEGGPGGAGPESSEGFDTVGFSARAAGPLSRANRNVARTFSQFPAVGTALSISGKLQERFPSVVPNALSPLTLREAMAEAREMSATTVSPTRGPDIRGGLASVSPTRGPDIRGAITNIRSTASLDGMSSSGTSSTQQQGPGETRAKRSPGLTENQGGGEGTAEGQGEGIGSAPGDPLGPSGQGPGSSEGPGIGGGRGGGPGGRF